MEQIIVNPLKVRGLGNVIDEETIEEMGGYNSSISQNNDDNYGTVYSSEYLSGSYLSLSYDSTLDEPDDLTVTATLKKASDNTVISSSEVKCYYNNEVYTATTNNSGVCTFTLPIQEDGHHYFKVIYEGTSSIGGCIKAGRIYYNMELEDIEIYGSADITQTNDDVTLLGVCVPGVPGVTVNFYQIHAMIFKDLPTVTANKTYNYTINSTSFAIEFDAQITATNGSCWFRVGTNNSNCYIIGLIYGRTQQGIRVRQNGTDIDSIYSSFQTPLNTDVHIKFTYDNGIMTYDNGDETLTITDTQITPSKLVNLSISSGALSNLKVYEI